MGMQEYLKDLGVTLQLRVHTDSSAAVGIVKRLGLGTQRHLAVNTLWVQGKLREKAFQLFKVKGDENPADIFTKHLSADKMHRCLGFLGAHYREGRPASAPMCKDDERMITDDGYWEISDDAKAEAYNGEMDKMLDEGLYDDLEQQDGDDHSAE